MMRTLGDQWWSSFLAWLVVHAPLVFLLLSVAVFALAVALIWSRGRGSRHIATQRRVGEKGERRAIKILKRQGYRIVDSQVSQSYQIEIDSQPLTIRLRADFIVEKGGRLFVAEAKSGMISAKVSGRATRRQLLEYLYAFEVSGVLLVDVSSEAVHSVQFPKRLS